MVKSTRKKREQRQASRRKVNSAGTRSSKRKSRSSSHLIIPNNVTIFNPKEEGDYNLAILPFVATERNPMVDEEGVGSLWYEMAYWRHRGIGVRKRYVACPRETFENPCPICELSDKLADDDYEKNKKVISGLYAQERQLFLLIDLDRKKKGLQLWDVAYRNFGKLLDQGIDRRKENDEFIDFHDPDDGMDLCVTLGEESVEKTKYLQANHIDFVERKSKIPSKFYDHGICLDEVVAEFDYDKISALLYESKDTEEEGSGGRSSKKKKASGRAGSRTAKSSKKKSGKKRTSNDDWNDSEHDEDVPW